MNPEYSGHSPCQTVSQAPLNFWEDALVNLINVPSVSGNERAMSLALEEMMRAQFPSATIIRQSVAADRWNIIMQQGDPVMTLTSHIDVVPGGPIPSATHDAIYGRGACDAKGQIIAQLWGLKNAIEHGLSDFRCAYVVGEETNSQGARKFLELSTTKFILNGEPTKNKFVSRGWGGAKIQIEAFGNGTHSSFGTANSAIHKLLGDLHRLTTNLPPGLDINIGTIQGGTASNVQAPYAVCEACARFQRDEETLEELLRTRLKSSSWKHTAPICPGLDLYVPDFAPERDVEVRFGSDASIYRQKYSNVLLFGPGDIAAAHTDNESISRKELHLASLMICHLLESLK